MVYGSLSAITFLILLKNNEAIAQCTGRVELIPQCCDAIPSTAYIQPVGKVCFPAVIQIPETNNYPNTIASKQSDDDDYINLIFLLITALTGCSNNGNSCARSNSNCNNGRSSGNGCNCNSCVQNNNPNSYFNLLSALIPCLCNDNPSSSSGYICDICASNNCPCSNFNQQSASTSYVGPSAYPNGPSSNYGCTCDICGPNNILPNFNSICVPSPFTTNGPISSSGCICDVCANSFSSTFNPFSALVPSIGCNIPAPSSGYICDSCAQNSCNSPNINTAPTCIYVPYPIAVPMNLPGFNFDDCYPEYDDGPQEIRLIIKTDCD